jgi:hypothetical protein
LRSEHPGSLATLMAFYIRGRSLKQMSREFEMPIGTINRRRHVARNRLNKVLERGVNFKLPYGRGSSARITQSLDKPSGNPTTLLWLQFSS